jgi:hypothetical protein
MAPQLKLPNDTSARVLCLDHIDENIAEANFRGGSSKYLLRSFINAIMTRHNIRMIIENDTTLTIQDDDKPALIKDIRKHGPRMFVIACYTGLRMECLRLMLRRPIQDRHPPINPNAFNNPIYAADIDAFKQAQLHFLRQPSSFKQGNFARGNLIAGTLIPINLNDSRGTGTSGTVYEASINSRYYTFPS